MVAHVAGSRSLGRSGGRRAQAARKTARTFLTATRAYYLPVLVTPLTLGAAQSARDGHGIRPLDFAVTLAGASAAHLASNISNDYYDYRLGADEMVGEGSVLTGSGVLLTGVLSERQVRRIMWGLWSAALASSVALTRRRGWPVLGFSVGGFVLGHYYTSPPVKLAYIGRGLGEIDLLLCFGPLTALGSYYVQSGRLSWKPVVGSLPPGLLTALILFNHHFLHWRSDLAADKLSPVAALGEERALRVSRYGCFAPYVALVAGVTSGALSRGALVALATAPRLYQAWREAASVRTNEAYSRNMMAALKASVQTGVILIASEAGSMLLRRFGGGEHRRRRRGNKNAAS
jgi:1,4-dihydroxy-2-naphthoate polyprenyltransferase